MFRPGSSGQAPLLSETSNEVPVLCGTDCLEDMRSGCRRVSLLPVQPEILTLSAPLLRNLSRLPEYREANLKSRQIPMFSCHLMRENSLTGNSGPPGQNQLSFRHPRSVKVPVRTISEVSLRLSSLDYEAFRPGLQKAMRYPLAPSSRLLLERFRCRIARSAFPRHASKMCRETHP